MDYTDLKPQPEVHRTGILYDLKSLFAFLQRVTDPRHARGKQYPLELLLVLILLAKLCGENTPTGIADWVTCQETKNNHVGIGTICKPSLRALRSKFLIARMRIWASYSLASIAW